MKDFLRDELKYKEMPSKGQEKDQYHQHFRDFAYSHRYEHQYLTYLLNVKSLVNTFFYEKVWLTSRLPTFSLTNVQFNSVASTYSHIFFDYLFKVNLGKTSFFDKFVLPFKKKAAWLDVT